MNKRKARGTQSLACVLITLFLDAPAVFSATAYEERRELNQARKCEACHERTSPGIVNDWERSLHAKAKVTCVDCHQAHKTDTDARAHEGAYISAVVSPRDCAKCHPKEVVQFSESRHAKAVSFVQDLEGNRGGDDILAYEIEGKAAAINGCEKCHGSIVKVENGRPDADTWPNGGIGRINPDGSAGSCSACHTRHTFSIAEARRPQTCGTCHMGPDHPQLEIYLESKHGTIYSSEGDSWNMSVAPDAWDVKHYRAPTCATCHLSGIGELEPTHNVSDRLSWELERPLTVKTEDWTEKRARMKSVCLNCHSANWVDNFYSQFDGAVKLYNEEYCRPAQEAMDALYSDRILTPVKFDEEIEFKFFELWHHEGRRARMGAAMMGPDFAQWHGFYELAKSRLEFKEMGRRLREGEKNKTH